MERGALRLSESPQGKSATSLGDVVKKRWRGWLRAVHRDFGYVAVGFTVIYALSGLAINHIADWDPNFVVRDRVATLDPIVAAGEPDAVAGARVAAAAGTPAPDASEVFRAGDELRISYADGTAVSVVGDHVTVHARSPRFFFRVANWLHYNRGKAAWTYVADLYAVMLLYLAISGIFMIKGRLGLKWRGAVLVSAGVLVPLGYVVLSGGPEAKSGGERVAMPEVRAQTPPAQIQTGSGSGSELGSGSAAGSDAPVLAPLPSDDNGT